MPEDKATVITYVVICGGLVNVPRSRPRSDSISCIPVITSCDVDASVRYPEHVTNFHIVSNHHTGIGYSTMKQDVDDCPCYNNNGCFVPSFHFHYFQSSTFSCASDQSSMKLQFEIFSCANILFSLFAYGSPEACLSTSSGQDIPLTS